MGGAAEAANINWVELPRAVMALHEHARDEDADPLFRQPVLSIRATIRRENERERHGHTAAD